MDIQLKPIQKPSSNITLSDGGISFKNCDVVIIGREPNCDLTLECDQKIISRQHARISKFGNAFKLTDTSANGTYINDHSQPLGNGNSIKILNNDVIRLGDYALKVNFANDLTSPKSSKPKPALKMDDNKRRQILHQKKLNALKSGTYKKEKTSTRQSAKALGKLNESFAPPNVTIPENWDTSPGPKKETLTTQIPNKLTKPISFSEQDTALLKNLMKGLGISTENTETTLTNDNMLALGRCLRASIAGMIKQRDQSDKIKSKLCFDDNNLLKALNYSSFANFKTTEDFLQKLLSDQQKTHTEFPLEVIKSQKELMEDQVVIYKSYNKAIDSFREELSPFTIETLFQEKQKGKTNLAEKLVPSIGKWDIYKKQWSEKCLNFKSIIKKNFEENIKPLHQKRINERQVINKNKK